MLVTVVLVGIKSPLLGLIPITEGVLKPAPIKRLYSARGIVTVGVSVNECSIVRGLKNKILNPLLATLRAFIK